MPGSQSPPTETGIRLAMFHRGPDEQLRINWSEFEGSPYVSFRMWTRDRRGTWWPDPRRGLSVRVRELRQVAEAIETARGLAEEFRGGWLPIASDQAARKPARIRRQTLPDRRPVAGPIRPLDDDQGEPGPFDEFA